MKQTLILFVSLAVATCGCQTFHKDKDDIKKIAHDAVDEGIDNVPNKK